MSRWISTLAGLMLASPLAAQAQVDLSQLDRDMTGPRAQVLVLATTHLSGMPESFDPASLDGVLERLAAFDPDIITIEALPGEECDLASRYPERFGSTYCTRIDAAREATGLGIPEAITEVDRRLKAWPTRPTPAQRRHLAALFLAAHDRASAYAQWLQLPAAERRAGDGLDATLVDLLKQLESRNNEDYQIGARLAARLGLERLHPIDNHTGDRVDVADVGAFGEAVEGAWRAGSGELDARADKERRLKEAPDLLPLYRFLNDPEYLRILADVNVHAAVSAESTEGYPQMWVAGWEIRNLRMVANIRETFRERPGARVLVIVGASHKPWFDHWLGQLQGVDVVEALQILE